MILDPDIQEAMRRRPGEKEEPPGPILTAFGVLVASVFAIGILRLLALGAITLWDRFPYVASSLWGALAIGAVVALLGGFLFVLRETKRFFYASLELGAAIGVSAEACLRLGPTTSKSALVFALLGGIYIAVRAFDNFAKAREENPGGRSLSRDSRTPSSSA